MDGCKIIRSSDIYIEGTLIGWIMVGPACPGNDYVHMVKVKGDTIRVNPIKVKFSVEKQY